MKTSLFWGRCRAPQTVVDLCALGENRKNHIYLMHKNEFQFKNTGSIIPIYRKSNKRERKPMKYYIKFIGFTLFEKETYLL